MQSSCWQNGQNASGHNENALLPPSLLGCHCYRVPLLKFADLPPWIASGQVQAGYWFQLSACCALLPKHDLQIFGRQIACSPFSIVSLMAFSILAYDSFANFCLSPHCQNYLPEMPHCWHFPLYARHCRHSALRMPEFVPGVENLHLEFVHWL